MQNNIKDLNQDQYLKQTWDNLSWELLENLDYQEQLKEKEKQSDISKLWEVFTYLFGTQDVGNYCCYTKNWAQCSDWSDLYTIIKYRWKDLIIKVWAWEFNTDVFNTWWISELKWLHNTPIPLFVVNQWDSHRWDDHKKQLRSEKPKEYLNKYAVIIVPKWWKAYFRWYGDKKNPINLGDINIRDFKETLNQWRLAILHKEFPNWQFATCLKIIEKFQEMDFERFYSSTRRNKQHLTQEMEKVLWCFRRMWIYRAWSWVWDKKAYQALYDIIKSFNLQKESF